MNVIIGSSHSVVNELFFVCRFHILCAPRKNFNCEWHKKTCFIQQHSNTIGMNCTKARAFELSNVYLTIEVSQIFFVFYRHLKCLFFCVIFGKCLQMEISRIKMHNNSLKRYEIEKNINSKQKKLLRLF